MMLLMQGCCAMPACPRLCLCSIALQHGQKLMRVYQLALLRIADHSLPCHPPCICCAVCCTGMVQPDECSSAFPGTAS